MAVIPSCKKLRRSCREIDLTIRIADLSESRREKDAAATWILGHNERITFGQPYKRKGELRVDCTIHAPCRYLKSTQDGQAECRAHGFTGAMPESSQPESPDELKLGGGRVRLVEKGRVQPVTITERTSNGKSKSLPVLQPENPCLSAECRTSDNRVGAACCRDMKLEVVLKKKRKNKEALLRTRKAPYVCKFEREDKNTVEVEVISACNYLGDDGISCVLHDMARPNGKSAKPELCYEWPDFGKDETGHPGCVFV